MKKKVALFSLCALAVMAPQAARQTEARENSLSGGGSISYEIYDKSGDAAQTNGNDNYSRIIISPALTVRSLGDKNSIELTYSPSVAYGDGDNGDLRQGVKGSASWSPTSRWTFAIADSYQETDTDLDNINRARFTPQPAPSPGGSQGAGGTGGTQPSPPINDSQLTGQTGRQKYSDNTFSANTSYQYWEDSFFNFGYQFDQLRYDQRAGSNQDFDRHTVSADIRHRLNSQYSLTATASYVTGSSDQAGQGAANSASADVDEYHVSTSLQSLTIPHHPLSLSYSLGVSAYDDDRRANSQVHTLLLGWTWEINPKATFSLSAGPTYEKSDNGSWSYALNASYSHQWSATGQISFNVSHGMENRNFSGNSGDNGLTEYWRAGVGISQALSQTLSLNLMATAADENVTQQGANGLGNGSRNTRQYSLGGGLSYSFGRWYSLGLNYTYTTQDGDLPEDNYDEQRLMLVLSMQRDFFHW